MKTRSLLRVLLLLSALPFCAHSQVTYEVSWPTNHLEGTFTLGFGMTFGDYRSTQAQGTYTFGSQTILTNVEFWVQPNFTYLRFWGENGTAPSFDDYPPVVNGQYVSWADPQQAWTALLAQGTIDGVSITIVPEPVSLFLLGLVLLLPIFLRRRNDG